MREYESIFVLDPEVEDARVDVEVGKIRDVVTGGSGEITEVQKWGRRKLAYEVKKKKEGIYTLVRFKAGSDVLTELNRRFRLNEDLLRHLTVVYEGPIGDDYVAPSEGSAAPAAEAPAPAPAEVADAPAPAAEAPAAAAEPAVKAEAAPEEPAEETSEEKTAATGSKDEGSAE